MLYYIFSVYSLLPYALHFSLGYKLSELFPQFVATEYFVTIDKSLLYKISMRTKQRMIP